MKVKNKLGPAQPRPASQEALYAARNAWERGEQARAEWRKKWAYRQVMAHHQEEFQKDCDKEAAVLDLCYVRRIFRTDV